ncbi:MAG: acetyltransferase [Pseudomonadota bacterium]
MILNRPVIIIGAGGHAKVLISSLNVLRREIVGILHSDVSLTGQSIAGAFILGNDNMVKNYASDSVELVNGLGSVSLTEKRKNIYLQFKKDGYSFATVIHPTATIISGVQLGEGVQIMAGAIVQIGCIISNNTIINTGSVVDHDCIIGAHVHIAPGAVLSGGVQIGDMTHIGTAATIIQGIKVGDGVIIGAGAVVIKDIPANVMVVGVPARIVEKR